MHVPPSRTGPRTLDATLRLRHLIRTTCKHTRKHDVCPYNNRRCFDTWLELLRYTSTLVHLNSLLNMRSQLSAACCAARTQTCRMLSPARSQQLQFQTSSCWSLRLSLRLCGWRCGWGELLWSYPFDSCASKAFATLHSTFNW